MQKAGGAVGKILVPRTIWLKQAWGNIILLLLALASIGAAVVLGARPEWATRADIALYNKGVVANNAPPGRLPAVDGRPEEYPIERADAYYLQAASKARDDRLKSIALYNRGTQIGRDAYGLSIMGYPPPVELAHALTSLGEAVRSDPHNEDAKYNLELMEKAAQVQSDREGAPEEGYSPGAIEKGY